MKKIMITTILLLMLVGCVNKEKTSTIELLKNEVEVNTVVNSCELIKAIDGDAVNQATLVKDRLSFRGEKVICSNLIEGLGDQTIKVNYANKEYELIINVVDTTAPEIEITESLFKVEVNNKYFDILSLAKTIDNYDKNPSIAINGSYDISKEGTYNVQLVARDKYNNISKKDIQIVVVAKEKEVVIVPGEPNTPSQGSGNGNVVNPVNPVQPPNPQPPVVSGPEQFVGVRDITVKKNSSVQSLASELSKNVYLTPSGRFSINYNNVNLTRTGSYAVSYISDTGLTINCTVFVVE